LPVSPKPRCRTCKKIRCTDPTHKPKAFANGVPSRQRRPGWDAGRKRREAIVKQHRAQYGDWCPLCGRSEVKLSADHITPVALGGSEDGPLRVACMDCQHKQAGHVGAEVQRRNREKHRE